MVPATIPFAVAAAFFPAAVAVMLWLLATPPRVRRGVVYLGGAFVAFAVGLAFRRPQLSTPDPSAPPRLRRGGYVAIFLLGAVMWTPSFAYVVAIDLIVNSGLSLPAQIANLVVVDVIVLAPVEAPLLLYGVAPGAVTAIVTKIDLLVRRYFWQLGTITAGAGGTYLVVRGWLQLSH